MALPFGQDELLLPLGFELWALDRGTTSVLGAASRFLSNSSYSMMSNLVIEGSGDSLRRTVTKSEPQIAIAMAIYRPHVPDFAEQLASIERQSYRHWKCFITADSPLADLRREPCLAQYFGDERFQFEENPNRLGVTRNFERALGKAAASGAEFLACADQDDVWYPEKLARLAERLLTCPPLSLVHSDMDVLLEGELQRPSAWEVEQRAVEINDTLALFVRNVVTGASMLFDAELFRRFPQFPSSDVLHDHYLAVLASLHGGVYPLHQRLYAYRQHAHNVIGVRPYKGWLDGMTFSELLRQTEPAMRNFDYRRAMFESLPPAAKECSARRLRIAFGTPADGGICLLLIGVAFITRPPFARECFALAAGKFLSLMRGRSHLRR
jgi:hypothetical protein